MTEHSDEQTGIDLHCRCLGVDGRSVCEREASEEDGLCDGCRCLTCGGSCNDHHLYETEILKTGRFKCNREVNTEPSPLGPTTPVERADARTP